jgi:acid phosphatase class B
VVVHLQTCTWRTSPFMRAQRTRRWHISKSISHGVCDGDVTLAQDAGRRGARTRRCSRAAVAM